MLLYPPLDIEYIEIPGDSTGGYRVQTAPLKTEEDAVEREILYALAPELYQRARTLADSMAHAYSSRSTGELEALLALRETIEKLEH